MAFNGRRRFNIGLLVANIEDVFSNSVAKGAMEAAEALDVDLIIFPGKYVGIEDKYVQVGAEYEYQHNVLFKHAAAMKPDMIIAAIGTIGYALDNEQKKEFLDKLGDVPILSVAAEVEGYDYLLYDNRSGVEQAVDFMAAQGRKHICMIVGDKGHQECLERYEAYRAALEKNGLDFEERYAVECDVSEMCRAECEMLIRNNPDMDAVYCVNDTIAEVMCAALKDHKKRIGRDISVAGFDDLPSSSEMDPPLASVRADAVLLGKRALEKAVNTLLGIKDERHYVETQFVPRRSALSEQSSGDLNSGMFEGSVEDMVRNITEFSRWKNEGGSEERLETLSRCMNGILIALRDELVTRDCTENGYRRILDSADELFSSGCLTIDDVANSYDIIDDAYSWANERCSEVSRVYLRRVYKSFYRRMTLDSVMKYRELQDSYAYQKHMDNIFIRDAVMFGASLRDGYGLILKRLTNIGADTGYLYIFREPVTHLLTDEFTVPEDGRLMSYCYGAETYTVPEDEQSMRLDEIAGCRFLPQGRRYTLLAAALFSNEKQYGIAFIEPRNTEFFGTLELADYQLSSAVKSIELMKNQERIRAELHSRNMALDQMSKIDELTGIFNRRGFYVAAEELISECRGKMLVVCYADMDNLKLVNDSYGHAEGDFAIRLLAECMEYALKGNGLEGYSIIGRMGGDEYAGITVGGSAEEIRRRKEEFLERFNASGEKSYLINMSIGMYCCTCDNSYDLRDALDKADGLLYEAKTRRKKNISKGS